MVDFWVKKRFNPFVKSISGNTTESHLQVACRWDFLSIVDILLKSIDYPRKEVENSYGLANNSAIDKMLKEYVKNKFRRKGVSCC